MPLDRKEALALIEQNIRRSGFHIYLVGQSQTPRFAYTIGLRESLGHELVLPGAVYYSGEEIYRILHAVRAGELGSFTLREADPSWVELLMLGAVDYYQTRAIEAYQIVPDRRHWTIDTPDLTVPYAPETAPAWRWLREPWSYDVPKSAHVMTPLDVLHGARVNEVMRWGDDEWEMFTGDEEDLSADHARVVPIGTMIGADPSLAPALDLEVGHGLWREPDDDEWQPMRAASD